MRIEPNPSIHQHFLENEKILEREIEIAKLTKKDKVIEIGTGDGRLTKLISKKVKEVKSFEIDERFEKELKNLKLKNVEFVFSDAIKNSWEGYNKIVSNIPYSLSEQVIEKSVKEGIKELVLIVGGNFKEKLENVQGDVGALSEIFFDLEIFDKIDKKEFNPIPRVNSYLVKLVRKKEGLLQKIYLRKGKVKNAIIYGLVSEGKTKREAREIIDNLRIGEDKLEESTRGIRGRFLKELGEKL